MKHMATRVLNFVAFALIGAATMVVANASAQNAADSTEHQKRAFDTDTGKVITLNREVFRYSSDGRRDPFVSLMTSTDLRPVIADLRLTTVAFDPTGRNSVAVLRDLGTKEQYRVKVGTPLGRMRVVRIDQKAVTFAIEEFGFSRQETLSMGESTRTTSNTRTP